jgi:hypothetical protein
LICGPCFIDGDEGDFVAGAELAEFPEFGIHDDAGADEAAEAGAVGAEDDRHVAGEIDRADGVGVVVEVGRMETGLAAVATRPFRFRADQADAGAGGVVMHFPCGGEEGGDVFVEEEIGRGVGSVENADLPVIC